MSYQCKIKIEIIHIVAIKFVSFKNNKIINDLDFKGLCHALAVFLKNPILILLQ